MRQRVMIGMALALEPKVVIMDEPTTALDVAMQRQILRQLVGLRERLDRMAIMYGGRTVEQAPAAALWRDSLHPFSDGPLHSFPVLREPRRN